MKTITINVPELLFLAIKKHAKRRNRSTSELIRESMEYYLRTQIEERPSLKSLIPMSLGELKGPLSVDDTFGEMLDD